MPEVTFILDIFSLLSWKAKLDCGDRKYAETEKKKKKIFLFSKQTRSLSKKKSETFGKEQWRNSCAKTPCFLSIMQNVETERISIRPSQFAYVLDSFQLKRGSVCPDKSTVIGWIDMQLFKYWYPLCRLFLTALFYALVF